MTRQNSKVLVRNLVRTALSTICYCRGIFPEDSFTEKNLCGILLKSLETTEPEGRQLVTLLEKGVFDALNKQYLDEFVLSLHDEQALGRARRNGDSEPLPVEEWSFTISYPSDGVNMAVTHTGMGHDAPPALRHVTTNNSLAFPVFSSGTVSREEATRATTGLLHTIIELCRSLGDLPPRLKLSLRVRYNSHAPVSYSAPGFDNSYETTEDSSIGTKLPVVQTSFHSVCVGVSSSVLASERASQCSAHPDPRPGDTRPEPSRPRKKVGDLDRF